MRCALLVAAALALATAASATAALDRGEAVIRTDGKRVVVRVEIAKTPEEMRVGLMFRRSLAPNAGMIFLFPGPTRGGFWMKNTLIPLSIAFIDARWRIRRILDMTPCREDPCRVYRPGVTYTRALEVNRGAFRRWGVEVGDPVTLRRLDAAGTRAP